jgi:hypothetical protein
LPPACLELNSAENIGQYLRQAYLSNRVFESYAAILDACQDAWRKLLAEVGPHHIHCGPLLGRYRSMITKAGIS